MSDQIEPPDPPPPPPPVPPSVRKRRRLLIETLAAALLVTLAGLGAARLIKSPGQALADAAPPAPSVITAKVERRVLVDTVVLRGLVSAEQTVEVTPQVGTEDAAPVVTAVRVKPGDPVRAGDVLIEVSGRPVFALPGRIPVYRDLRPGSEGADVRQLQAALRAQGFGSGDLAGTYGEGTEAAVRSFYAAAGYEPLPASEEDDELLEQAQDAVTEARRALRDAELVLAATRKGQGEAGSGPLAVAQAAQAVNDRREDGAKAAQKLALVRRQTGPMVSAGELVFLRGFPARVDGVHVAVGTKASGKLVTVSAGRLVVKSQLSPQQRDLVRRGQRVQLYAELLGISSRGKVQSVSDSLVQPEQPEGSESGEPAPSDPAGVGDAYEMVAMPTEPLDPKTAGQDIRVTVVAATTRAKVLSVPLAAVSAGADGETAVTVAAADGTRQRVEVRPGASGDGYVQVTPIGATLQPDDQVVVGTAP